MRHVHDPGAGRWMLLVVLLLSALAPGTVLTHAVFGCVCMLQEEAVQVTGLTDPQAAAEAILARPGAKTEWCVVKMGGKGALLVTKSPQQRVYRAGAFKVCRERCDSSSMVQAWHCKRLLQRHIYLC